jgi:type IV secretory pathway VirB4 component
LVDRFNQLNALLATVPGDYARLFRRMVLVNSQAADLALWAKSDAGESWNAHLNRECLGIMRTLQGTQFCFNLHGRPRDGSPDVAHTIISGRTGTGKSALGGLLAMLLLRYKPHILICDRGGSYHSGMEAACGMSVTVAPGQPCGLNPFAERPTAEHLSFLVLFVRTLIECSGQQMTGPQLDELHGEIGRLYDLEPRFRTLGYLCLGLSKALLWARGDTILAQKWGR